METSASATGAKQPPKSGAGEEDLSMEEILQSIRKIIAEDEDDKKKTEEEVVPGSDVLELTEMLEEEPVAEPADVLQTIDDALVPEPPKPTPSLLSNEVAATASAAIKKLQAMEPDMPPLQITPTPHFRSGNTVEDMVYEMLRPMLKEWLDTNLPAIVERIVEREIKKLTQ